MKQKRITGTSVAATQFRFCLCWRASATQASYQAPPVAAGTLPQLEALPRCWVKFHNSKFCLVTVELKIRFQQCTRKLVFFQIYWHLNFCLNILTECNLLQQVYFISASVGGHLSHRHHSYKAFVFPAVLTNAPSSSNHCYV